MANPDYGVAIAGGGMAGAALALALGRAGVRVALIEPKPPAGVTRKDRIGLRVSALSPASEAILNSLGVWRDIEQVRAAPFRRMEVWDAGGSGRLDFDCAELNEPRLGHIVENQLVQGMLWAALRVCSHVEVFGGSAVGDFAAGEDRIHIELDNGDRLSAILLVAADGGESRIRRRSGIEVRRWDYEQRALVTHVQTEKPHRDGCYQRFLAGGPLAFLPLGDGRSSIVWSTTPAQARELESVEPPEFARRAEEAMEGNLGRISGVGPRASFPLRYLHAKQYCAPRVALLGDAAHVVHPLAGQGANLGFLDAAALAQVIAEARADRRDFGAVNELRRYERWRKGDNLIMANALHGLKYLFGAPRQSAARMRNLGLDAVNELKPVKQMFMRRATGLSGRQPKLVAGEPI